MHPLRFPPNQLGQVQREIAIMKKLVHPNIVQLVEVIDAPLERSLYLVMEYVERGAVMRCTESGMGRYECPSSGGWTSCCWCPDCASGVRVSAVITNFVGADGVVLPFLPFSSRTAWVSTAPYDRLSLGRRSVQRFIYRKGASDRTGV